MLRNSYIDRREDRGIVIENILLTIAIVIVGACLAMIATGSLVRNYRALNAAEAEMNAAHYERVYLAGGVK